MFPYFKKIYFHGSCHYLLLELLVQAAGQEETTGLHSICLEDLIKQKQNSSW